MRIYCVFFFVESQMHVCSMCNCVQLVFAWRAVGVHMKQFSKLWNLSAEKKKKWMNDWTRKKLRQYNEEKESNAQKLEKWKITTLAISQSQRSTFWRLRKPVFFQSIERCENVGRERDCFSVVLYLSAKWKNKYVWSIRKASLSD